MSNPMANYYELTLTSTSKEELEKIQFQLTKTLFEPHWKVTTGNIEERCEHGIDLNEDFAPFCCTEEMKGGDN